MSHKTATTRKVCVLYTARLLSSRRQLRHYACACTQDTAPCWLHGEKQRARVERASTAHTKT